MKRGKLVHEGKAKIVYESDIQGMVIQHFKDDVTAFNNQKKSIIHGKGVMNNRISAFLMQKLNDVGIHTHFVRCLNMREQLVRRLSIIPIEVVIRNVAAGSIVKRLGIPQGHEFKTPLIDFFYKNDELGDPPLSSQHILELGYASDDELDDIISQAFRINDFLSGIFYGINIRLVDFKLEFGRSPDGDGCILLADEISPDSCRLWDCRTNEPYDKDLFRQDIGGLDEAYCEIGRRLGIWKDLAGSMTDKASTHQIDDTSTTNNDKEHHIIRADVSVYYRSGVFDPQSHSIWKTLQKQGHVNLHTFSQKKLFSLEWHNMSLSQARSETEKLCQGFLSNPVMEDWAIAYYDGQGQRLS